MVVAALVLVGGALVAAPELIEHLLRSAAHQYVKRAAQVVARGARLLSLVLYALALVIVVLSALGGAHQAISVSIFLLILIGFIEIVARQTRRIIGDIATGGDVDVRFAERFGPSARWGIAGTLFLAGTLIQLIGTFVE